MYLMLCYLLKEQTHMFSLAPISGNKGCEAEGARFADMICHDFIQSTASQVSLHIRT